MPPNIQLQHDLERGDSSTKLGKRNSVLEPSTDPFALRKGKKLVWRNVNMKLAAAGKEKERFLLDNVWGEVPVKETTAIMGPSGAGMCSEKIFCVFNTDQADPLFYSCTGKSSLLNILSGRAQSQGRISVSADIRLDNYPVDPTDISVRKHIAFVAQDDSLQVTATPREAIRFSAKLRLPRSTDDSQLDQLTERMLTELGLTGCADTIVGGELIKGISGGERKRTSVGVELVTKPALVFLDEPTSGKSNGVLCWFEGQRYTYTTC
jgi:ABC-type multidrug transport system ATPase subunit